MSAQPRFPALDVLRLVAIGMTVLAHTPTLLARLPGLNYARHAMWLGVDLFMLISGWLLGGQLLREQARDGVRPMRFYFKRWMRTLPAYWFMLAALYFMPHAPEFAGPRPLGEVATHATFTQLYIGTNHYAVSWSLCVEEHFYLVLPLVIAAFRRQSWMALGAFTLCLEAGSIAARALTYGVDESIPFATHLRCHGLFLGFTLAFVHLRAPEVWAKLGRIVRLTGWVGILATAILLCSVQATPHPWTFIGAPTVGTWTFALVFLACVHERSPWSGFSFRGLTYLGGLTYSIYLTHSVIPRPLIELAGTGAIVSVMWRFLLMVVAALFVHHLVERPFLALRERALDRWFRDTHEPRRRVAT